MKILIIDEEFPYPLNTGKRIRSFNLLSRIARNNAVTYLAYGTESTESFEALKKAGLNPVAVPPHVPTKSGPLFYFRLLGNLLSRHPYIVTSHYSKVFAERLHEMIARERPDIIICEWTPYAIFVRDIFGPKKVIVAHNIEHRIWRRYYENEANFLKKWYIARQMGKVERFEKESFSAVDGATAVSEIEAEQIRGINPACIVAVVDNGVDPEYYNLPDVPENKNLVFVGSMNWRPNQDAINYFVHDIFPLIREKDKKITVTFVGQDPPEVIRKLGRLPGISVADNVTDVRPYVQNAAVSIVPLRIGGGSRLKILEAFAMRKAVVSTTVGAEGLEVANEKHLLLADTAKSFAEAILRLMNDSELRRNLGESGRQLAVEKYSWDILAEKLQRFLDKLMERQ
ncbi:putative Glycosyl transferase group 1 [Candidatus Zixiibacteriota bacterium]|nr:putative Glycosyl transferase group 1 [candidate division Zixibacteria bacterium]